VKEKGVLYVATGKRFVEESHRSLLSIRRLHKDLEACLYTDKESAELSICRDFDEVKILESPTFTWLDKIKPLKDTPYYKTLFLDTDTLVIADILEIFEALDHFDLGYAHASFRSWDGYDFGIPLCFAEPNSGMILYRNNDKFGDFVDRWFELYKEQLDNEEGYGPDQPSFRAILYRSNLELFVLPPEYNWRTIFPGFAGGGCKVKILHGREPTLSYAEKKINLSLKPRIFDFPKKVIFKRFILKVKSLFS